MSKKKKDLKINIFQQFPDIETLAYDFLAKNKKELKGRLTGFKVTGGVAEIVLPNGGKAEIQYRITNDPQEFTRTDYFKRYALDPNNPDKSLLVLMHEFDERIKTHHTFIDGTDPNPLYNKNADEKTEKLRRQILVHLKENYQPYYNHITI